MIWKPSTMTTRVLGNIKIVSPENLRMYWPLVFVCAGGTSKSKTRMIVGIVVPLFAVLLLGCLLLLFMWKGGYIDNRNEVFVDVAGLF